MACIFNKRLFRLHDSLAYDLANNRKEMLCNFLTVVEIISHSEI